MPQGRYTIMRLSVLTFEQFHLLVHEDLVDLGEVLQTRGAARDGLGNWHPVYGNLSCV